MDKNKIIDDILNIVNKRKDRSNEVLSIVPDYFLKDAVVKDIRSDFNSIYDRIIKDIQEYHSNILKNSKLIKINSPAKPKTEIIFNGKKPKVRPNI